MRASRPHLAAAVILCAWMPLAEAQSSNRDALRRQDLSFVSTQLPKLHLNFFFQLDPATFNQAVQALDAQIPTLTDAEFDVGLAALAAMAGDEHTFIFPVPPANAASARFPLVFRWLDDGVFVAAASADYARALGTQLVAVGDTPIDAVMQKLGTVIPHANQQWLHYYGATYLRYQPILQGLDILPPDTASNLTFKSLAGEQFTLAITPAAGSLSSDPSADAGSTPLYLQNSGQNYWFTYLPALRLLYFKYNQCQDAPGNPFAAFAASLLSTLDRNPVDSLVIDFRGNTGGDSSLLDSVINGLTARADALYANPRFVGYDIIDKGTFSSGILNAMTLKSLQLQAAASNPGLDLQSRLVVIGEPTGGSPSHYGNVTSFTLPNSQLTGQYSTKFFALQPYIPAGSTFNPDVAVLDRSTDFFARYDPVMAAIVARWNGAPPAPTGKAIVVNGASFRVEQGLAPGSFASVFGTFPDAVDAVFVKGQPGQILSTASSQINFVMPAKAAVGPAQISVSANGVEVASGQATITAAGPGIFVTAGTDPSQPGAVLNEDSSANGQSHPATAGSVMQIFATGYGPLDSSNQATVQVFFDNTPADVLYSGPLAQFPGLWQINARVPIGVSGQVSLHVVAEAIASNGVTAWIQ